MPATCTVRGLCSRYSHTRGAPHLAVRAPRPTTRLENGPLREDLSDTELTALCVTLGVLTLEYACHRCGEIRL